MPAMVGPPDCATLGSLRATREARRLATAILLDRLTGLGLVHCARCGGPIAVATDERHTAADYDRRVICRKCRQADWVAHTFCETLPLGSCDGELEMYSVDLEEWVAAGRVELPTEPDPRPTLRKWLRRMFLGKDDA